MLLAPSYVLLHKEYTIVSDVQTQGLQIIRMKKNVSDLFLLLIRLPSTQHTPKHWGILHVESFRGRQGSIFHSEAKRASESFRILTPGAKKKA